MARNWARDIEVEGFGCHAKGEIFSWIAEGGCDEVPQTIVRDVATGARRRLCPSEAAAWFLAHSRPGNHIETGVV